MVTMATNTGHVMTLANSIIGVSVLAMPFCFKQCGITLAIILLTLSSITSRLACHFLVKSSSMCKRRNFEFLAFYTFGPTGKLLVELGIIGFMMGTCVAFFVVIGDLGPEIISKMFHVKNDSTLRSMVLIGLGFCVILPLGLLRNIESLAAISTVTIGFYFMLVVKIFLESFSHLLASDWIQKVNFWQPEGVLQCIPIFSMALSCQTQIFEIYDALATPSLDKMDSVVRSAVNMCTVVYVSVGFLGYIAYCSVNFTGNILLSFAPSFASEMYKLGFVMSIAVSFPLVIFPCRASLYSLIYRRMPIHHELSQTNSYIPDLRFKCLTIVIVGVSLVTGLLIPSIELVLGFVGSTIGVAICVIFPALSFINLTNKETNERLIAKVTLIVGLVIMITGTLANLQAATEIQAVDGSYSKSSDMNIFPDSKLPKKAHITTESIPVLNKLPELKPFDPKKIAIKKPVLDIKSEMVKKPLINQKKEPPFPVAPIIDIKPSPKTIVSDAPFPVDVKKDISPDKHNVVDIPKVVDKNPSTNDENINKDAIEKEEREMQEIKNQKKKEEEQQHKELLEKLKEHENEQKKLLQEQQNILNALKNRDSERKANDMVEKEKKDEVNPESVNPKIDVNKKETVVETINASLKKVGVGEETGKLKTKLVEKPEETRVPPPVNSSEKKAEPPQRIVVKEKEPKSDVVKPNVAPMPLPLAKLQVQANMNQNNVKEDPVIQSRQEIMGRDILEESKELNLKFRQKRDAGEPEVERIVDEGDVKSDECPVHDERKQNGAVENANLELRGKTDESHETAKTHGEQKDVNHVQSDADNIESTLIKRSQHISMDFEVEHNLKLSEGGSGRILQVDSKISAPKKRDLKSMKFNGKIPTDSLR